MTAGDSPIRDIMLPHSDRIASTQVLIVMALTVAATWLVRRERALVQLCWVWGRCCSG